MNKALVTGAGGFIGHHLVKYLKDLGYWVRGADIKYPVFEPSPADDFQIVDLRHLPQALRAMTGVSEVYALAADMGGMGFIADPARQASIMYNNTLINLFTLEAARTIGVTKYLFASSVCVYPTTLLSELYPSPLREEDAYPALPQESYGWEKLQAEHMCTYYQSYGMKTRIARFQNCYGPLGPWYGGREKAPAALARKIAFAKLSDPGQAEHEIQVWGDGLATRAYMFIDDCLRGIYRLMQSDCDHPITLGPNQVISVNELLHMLASIAGVTVKAKHVAGPEGVRGRNFDHSRAREILGWKPEVSLYAGLSAMYQWIESEVARVHNFDNP